MTRKILVVDDEEPIRKSLSLLLSASGYAVESASDGEGALALYNAFQPDIVLSDMVLVRKQGIEVIIAIRAIDPDIPIVAMSGGARFRGTDALTLARRAGATASIEKPFEADELLTLIEKLLAPAEQ